MTPFILTGLPAGRHTLEVRWQDSVAIVGPNGSGKTTLLRAILGEVPLAAGQRHLGPGARSIIGAGRAC